MEIKDKRKSVVTVDQLSGQVIVLNPKARGEEKEKTFTFDTVFGCDTKQVDLYNEVARPIVEFVLEGYNGKMPCDNNHDRKLLISVFRISRDYIRVWSDRDG